MKIMVTGGAGYIGSHTANKLLQAGHEVLIYDNLSTGFSVAIPKAATFVLGDVRDATMLGRVIKDKKIEAVIHFAAKLIVPESILQPADYYENNTMGVLALVKASQQQGLKKIVFSSTAAVYGEATPGGLVSEDSPTLPIHPYGASKLMSERILVDAEKAYGIRSVSLRYFNVGGASEDLSNGPRMKNASQLIKVAAEVAAGKRPFMEIYGTDHKTPDGTCQRDYIHVDDLADLHLLALQYLENGHPGAILNAGYGHGYSVREVLDVMKKVSGVNFEVRELPKREGDMPVSVADTRQIKKILKWQPKFDSLETICRTTYEWEKKGEMAL